MSDHPAKGSGSDDTRASQVSSSSEQMEAKRQAARRRFLLGTATMVPVLFSVKQANAQITVTQCLENIFGDGFTFGAAFFRGIFGTFVNCGTFAAQNQQMIEQMNQQTEAEPSTTESSGWTSDTLQ